MTLNELGCSAPPVRHILGDCEVMSTVCVPGLLVLKDKVQTASLKINVHKVSALVSRAALDICTPSQITVLT